MKQSEIEKKILEFWAKDNTFKKSVDKKSPKGDYVFYDGPPFATGTPHYGHILVSVIKDIIPRYKTMRGYKVERRWGWDCHGLPIENIVEQEHGFRHKKDIVNFGVDKFNEKARTKVLKYVDDWKNVINRMGRWVDFDNDYKTMDLEYMESVWWVFKELYDKDLLYEAQRSMHICPRCETTLSQSEVAEGYKDVKDLSVIAKFELADEPKTYLLAWTTTPWTLPGNMAVAIGEDIDYVKVESGESKYILAKSRLGEVFENKEQKSSTKVDAKFLVKKKYKPLFPYYDNNNLEGRENAFRVYAGNDFVNTDEGTGIVHIAPAFGADDYGLSQQEQIPFVQHVNMDGTFKKEVSDFAGLGVKHQDKPNTQNHPEVEVEATDVKIIKYLAKKDLLFSKKKFEHSYPHCWRCDSPLLNYSTSSWFVKVEHIKKDLIKNAKKINWMPEHLKDGRFGNWLDGARDWSISRQRFWGSVMPVWVCEKDTNHKKVLGSVKELEELSNEKITDLHKHFVDNITFKCSRCQGIMKRIPDVLDCWFESGSMPFAQQHYPFENEQKFKENFPAEFISEAVDQTRTWFYYLHVLSTAIQNKPAFKHVVSAGMVLAANGKKMSKRLQNYPDPMNMFEKYGADAMRYYLASSPVMRAEDFRFIEKEVDEIVKKVILILYNVLTFYKMYAHDSTQPKPHNDHVLDEWIVAQTSLVTEKVTKSYDNYDLNNATRPIVDYINNLSTWYLRRSRDRFKSFDQKDKKASTETLLFCLSTLSKLMAPVMPFTAEHVWQELGNKESIHLNAWPKLTKVKNSNNIHNSMEQLRDVVEKGLSARAKNQIKIRQPLSKAIVKGVELEPKYEKLVLEELNVKSIEYIKEDLIEVELDTNITPELAIEGNLRELVRAINNTRKNNGLTLGDIVTVTYTTNSEELKKVFEQFEDELKLSIIASEIKEQENSGEEIEINKEKITFSIQS